MPQRKQAGIRIEDSLLARCSAFAKADGVSTAEWVRYTLRSACDHRDLLHHRDHEPKTAFKPLHERVRS